MSLFITSLNSGSNGNCYYIGNNSEAVLVDVGISCREVERRMTRSGLLMQKVKAVFISHEHIDHIRGVEVLSKKYNLPVYITDATLKNSPLNLKADLVRSFNAYESVTVGELAVTAFPKFHDAVDPCSFIIAYNAIKIGVFTDIGSVCDHVAGHFKQCNAAFLEANYDEELLENGRYPIYLKNRIRGGKGHLSNMEALELFIAQRGTFLSLLILSHLSKENNRVELVEELFTEHAGNTNIVVASRYEETAVFEIHNTVNFQRKKNKERLFIQSMQLSLFPQ